MNVAAIRDKEMAGLRKQLADTVTKTRSIVMSYVDSLDALAIPVPRRGEYEMSPVGLGPWTLVDDFANVRVLEFPNVPDDAYMDWHNHPQHEIIRVKRGKLFMRIRTNGHYRRVVLDALEGPTDFKVPAGAMHKIDSFQNCSMVVVFKQPGAPIGEETHDDDK